VTVQELRDTLVRLIALLEAADAKAATTRGLSEFVEATAGFGELSLKAFVGLAEKGRTPAAEKTAGSLRAKSTKGGKDPVAIAAEVKDLYERAADPNVSEEQVRTACGQLGALTKDGLVKLADDIGLLGMKAKKKDDIVAGITHRLLDRKGAAIRKQLINRPASEGEGSQSADGSAPRQV
jgi:hypothetical protein